jgi:hypothetical protein
MARACEHLVLVEAYSSLLHTADTAAAEHPQHELVSALLAAAAAAAAASAAAAEASAAAVTPAMPNLGSHCYLYTAQCCFSSASAVAIAATQGHVSCFHSS